MGAFTLEIAWLERALHLKTRFHALVPERGAISGEIATIRANTGPAPGAKPDIERPFGASPPSVGPAKAQFNHMPVMVSM